MSNQGKQLKDYSVEQLKAIVYDNSEQMQMLKNNIDAIRQEIMKRRETPVKMNGTKKELANAKSG